MRTAAIAGVTLVMIALTGGPATGHHGWTSYKDDVTVTVTGTIREALFEHPHVMLRVRASEKTWAVTLPPPTRATRLGLTAETLRVGMTIRLAGHPHRTEADEMRATRIILGKQTITLR